MAPPPARRAQPKRLLVTAENATFQILESLGANRSRRHKSRTFLLEGVVPITRALDHGWTFDAVIHPTGARLSSWAHDVIARSRPGQIYEMAPRLMSRLSGRTEGAEVLAVVRMAEGAFERIPIDDNLLVVVVDRPGNPGNLGTIVRSSDALGAAGTIVTGHGVDIYDPAVITASRGSLFAVPVVACPSHTQVVEWLASTRRRLGRCQMVGADESGRVELAEHDFRSPTLLVFGNETQGLSRAYRESCDALVRIPMAGAASSLNVAVAASIALYEVVRQRRAGLTRASQ